ncbi:hypothetical protein [Streptomyces sp. A5-4]|uniref:hypothetical protein n=1 Tax=Streptomyces sp. A5-4 TaxID=3384771 RepID=UPI003DA9F7DB
MTLEAAITPDVRPVPQATGSDFAQLSRRIVQAGLLDRRPLYYTVRFTLVGLVYLGGCAAFVVLGDSWSQLLVAFVMSLALLTSELEQWCGAPLSRDILFSHPTVAEMAAEVVRAVEQTGRQAAA